MAEVGERILNSQEKPDRLTLDDFFMDVFGLNVQALRTVRITFADPKVYFDAADDPDWFENYTPSIRLWLSLMAIVFFLQFFWAGENSPLVSIFAQQLENAEATLPPGASYRDLAVEFTLWSYGILPIALLAGMILLEWIYPFWGQKTTIAMRESYLF